MINSQTIFSWDDQFNYSFQEKGKSGNGKAGDNEEFDWEKFINDPLTNEEDARQDDPKWKEDWEKGIEGGGEKPKGF